MALPALPSTLLSRAGPPRGKEGTNHPGFPPSKPRDPARGSRCRRQAPPSRRRLGSPAGSSSPPYAFRRAPAAPARSGRRLRSQAAKPRKPRLHPAASSLRWSLTACPAPSQGHPGNLAHADDEPEYQSAHEKDGIRPESPIQPPAAEQAPQQRSGHDRGGAHERGRLTQDPGDDARGTLRQVRVAGNPSRFPPPRKPPLSRLRQEPGRLS